MCQVHTGTYVALLAPEKTDYTACRPDKTTTYILQVVLFTTHTLVRLMSIGKKKRREKAENKRIKKENENGKEKQRKEKTRPEEEARKGKE